MASVNVSLTGCTCQGRGWLILQVEPKLAWASVSDTTGNQKSDAQREEKVAHEKARKQEHKDWRRGYLWFALRSCENENDGEDIQKGYRESHATQHKEADLSSFPSPIFDDTVDLLQVDLRRIVAEERRRDLQCWKHLDI